MVHATVKSGQNGTFTVTFSEAQTNHASSPVTSKSVATNTAPSASKSTPPVAIPSVSKSLSPVAAPSTSGSSSGSSSGSETTTEEKAMTAATAAIANLQKVIQQTKKMIETAKRKVVTNKQDAAKQALVGQKENISIAVDRVMAAAQFAKTSTFPKKQKAADKMIGCCK